ncbi:hypothetical protein ACJIZ3_004345 [Penstemon smallii]|uniref:Uncharacterized protein n=1 Tax=Penstemon smallii TaxID=265156 RepID=A0ABD3S1Y2_9LAMI
MKQGRSTSYMLEILALNSYSLPSQRSRSASSKSFFFGESGDVLLDTSLGEGLDWLLDGELRTYVLCIFYELFSIDFQLETIRLRCICFQIGATLEGHKFSRVLQVIGAGFDPVGECCL